MAVWNREFPQCITPVWLWHILPGFVGETAVTVFRATEATYLESYRRFGFPTNHPCRLENHAGMEGGGGGDWTIVPFAVSPLGVPRYRLRSAAGRFLSADAANDRAYLSSSPTTGGDSSSWFVVPRTGACGRGWDIVHTGTGKRLVATADGRGVALTPWIHPTDHWDLVCVRSSRTNHRPHWWFPSPFFRDTFRDRAPEEPYGAVSPVVGSAVASTAALVRVDKLPRAEAVRRAEADPSVGFLSTNSGGGAVFYQATTGNSIDIGREAAPAADGGERERRAYQDATPPPPWGNNTYATFLARRSPPTDVYRECLVRIGMDAPACERLLPTSSTADAQATQARILGTAPGAVAAGLCDGPRLASAVCQRMCADQRSAESKICEGPLRGWCRDQTVPGCHDPLCACWLTEDAYRAAQADSLRRSGVDTGSPLYAALSKATQNTGQPVCTYGPCRNAAIRPAFVCPNTSTMVCLQEMSNNSVTAGGGDVRLTQSCNFVQGELSAGRNPDGGGDPAASTTDAVTHVLQWVDSLGTEDLYTAAGVCVALVLLVAIA